MRKELKTETPLFDFKYRHENGLTKNIFGTVTVPAKTGVLK
jgi:hypothetical protein